jgi:Ca2+-binding EF-hand superfamily protein
MVRMVILLLLFAEDVFKMYSQDEIENFRCIFDMFDKDRTGYVKIEDLQTIIQSLDRNPDEA